jgi:uncharacterized repeat protein (TIGR01451 family)
MLLRAAGVAVSDTHKRMRLLRRAWRIVWCAGLVCASGSAFMAHGGNDGERGNIKVSINVEKIVKSGLENDAEKTQLAPLDVENAGDEVVYTLAFENTSSRSIDSIRISSPIPPRMRYHENSAFGPGADVLYSVDGGKIYGKPNELLVATEEGISHIASATEYTDIRWVLKGPLEPGAKGFARFRAAVR